MSLGRASGKAALVLAALALIGTALFACSSGSTLFRPSQWAVTMPNLLRVGAPPQTYLVQNGGEPWSFSKSGGDNPALRFELRPGDRWSPAPWLNDPATKERTEITAMTRYAVGTNIRISYDFMLEPGAPNTAKWMVIGQLHQDGGAWQPPFAVQMVGEKMAINIGTAGAKANNWSQYHNVWIDPQNIVRGHTYHMEINVRFDSTNGHLDVSRDGVQIVDYNGPLGSSEIRATHWKQGLYREASDTNIAAVYSHLSVTKQPPLREAEAASPHANP